MFFRLEGADGQWSSFKIGADPGVAAGVLFTVQAPYATWKAVVRQQVHPLRGMIQGQLRVTGQLSSVLRWSKAFVVVTRVAGELDTTFEDEV
jgi:putative sterol carrier protein